MKRKSNRDELIFLRRRNINNNNQHQFKLSSLDLNIKVNPKCQNIKFFVILFIFYMPIQLPYFNLQINKKQKLRNMGNSLHNQKRDDAVQNTKQIKKHWSMNIQSQTCSTDTNIAHQTTKNNIRRSWSIQGLFLKEKKTSVSQKPQRKFLSLTKVNQTQSKQTNNNFKRETKGIDFITTTKSFTRPQSSINQTSSFTAHYNVIDYRQRQIPRVNSQPIFCPDSPKYYTIQAAGVKAIPHVSAIPLIKINYEPSKVLESQPNKIIQSYTSSLESSHVFPYAIDKNKFGQKWDHHHGELSSKKLKKVAMNRSFTENTNLPPNLAHNLEDQVQEKKICKQEVRKQSQQMQRSYNKQNKEEPYLFTDPMLYQYITGNRKPMSCKQTESKYAIPISHSDLKLQSSITLQTKADLNNKYSLSKWNSAEINNKLELAISKETMSKVFDQEGYRFPTLTDISEEDKPDNTSFLPLKRQSNLINSKFQSQALLAYCRPTIDDKVMADLLRLPHNQL